jgi:hypothetical protein
VDDLSHEPEPTIQNLFARHSVCAEVVFGDVFSGLDSMLDAPCSYLLIKTPDIKNLRNEVHQL